jgi:negative regulator of flagellin synthesis FlgM
MKITDKINIGGADLQKPKKVKGKVSQGKTGEATATSKTDQVSLSDTAKELNKLTEIVNSMPDVRADKVEALKNAIASGTYDVKGDAVAGKLIKSSIVDGLIAKK